MNIIAKTNDGFLIEASSAEVASILSATGLKPETTDKITVGTKIPAYDYAATIQRCKAFSNGSTFKDFKRLTKYVSSETEGIIQQIESLNFEE